MSIKLKHSSMFPRLWIALAVLITARCAVGKVINGRYEIGSGTWAISCKWPGSDKPAQGSDSIGKFSEISLSTTLSGTPVLERIRSYDDRPLALFSLTYQSAAAQPIGPFPVFDRLPRSFHVMSYAQRPHAPIAFDGEPSGSPWALFNDNADTFIISPASHFFIQTISGNSQPEIRSELRDTVANIPAGFTQQTLVAWGPGINHTWDTFGHGLTDLLGKIRPANDSDIALRYLGYWTNNGTWYYYNYDKPLGYAGTLLSIADHYRKENIPLGYMQLDSWWYPKTFTKQDGQVVADKNPNLPPGPWNRSGGLLEYRADPAVFHDGLADFQKQLSLPIMTHNRWIDPTSPYQHKYEISGYAALDPRYWQEVIGYVHSAGGFGYEQDWLSEIYVRSPALFRTVDAGSEFTDAMATAAADNGMTIQYCMPIPCYFLQAAAYPNVTTIRTSQDRLLRDRWHDFLYGSRLAYSVGVWPWTDCCMSTEPANLLLADLSAGIVGIGDQIGTENKQNIFEVVRADGVIIKPDAPLLPIDSSFIAESRGESRPLIAETYSDHEGLRTHYLLAYRVPLSMGRGHLDSSEDLRQRERLDPDENSPVRTLTISMKEIGVTAPAYIYDYFAKSIHRPDSSGRFTAPLHRDGLNYYIIAEPGPSGIALFGDEDKFVSSGRQRIASIIETAKSLSVVVIFAPGEPSICLHGCSPTPITAGGNLKVTYDSTSQHFTVEVPPNHPTPKDAVTTVEVTLQR
jgi:hypothetical protein